MKIDKKIEGCSLTISVEGKIDTQTAPQLQEELELSGVSDLVFDLSKVEYVSSAGLRIFLNAQKAMLKTGGKMMVRGANESVRKIFTITGFARIINLV